MKKYLSLTILFLIVSIVISSTTNASENQFEVSLEIGHSTTTPPIIPTSTPTITQSSGGSSVLTIQDLRILSSKDSSLLSFKTNHLAHSKVYWGLTENYEMGSISGLFYNFEHSVKISGLKPDTKYHFRIEVTDTKGAMVYANDSFKTLIEYNALPPINATHFQAIPKEESIALQWIMPRNENIDSIRIVRSDRFFPRDIDDGEIIFEGYASNYEDKRVVKNKTYYYALFTRDTSGKYSSGVLAQAKIVKEGDKVDIQEDPFANTKILQNVDKMFQDLVFSDFEFIQDGKRIENTESILTIDGKKNLTVILRYSKVPEILKTIAITLVDPEDSTKIFTFLLRVDKEKTLYESTIGPLGKSGKYKMNIVILDYKNQGLKRIEGFINALVWDNSTQKIFRNCGIFDEFGNCKKLDDRNKIILYLILLILLVIAILGFVLRRRDNKKESIEIHEE